MIYQFFHSAEDTPTYPFFSASHFKACERDLVDTLMKADLKSLLRKGVELTIIPEDVQKSFESLEPSVSDSLKIRYLLLHACEGLERDPGQCHVWFKVLLKHGMPRELMSQGTVSASLPLGSESTSTCESEAAQSLSSVSKDADSITEHSSSMQESSLCVPTLKIVRQSFDTEVDEGVSALLKVEADSNIEVAIFYQWMKDGKPLKAESSDYLGTNMPVLCVKDADYVASRGTYTCQLRASNDMGSTVVESKPVQLTVKTSQVKKTLVGRYSTLPDVQGDRKGLGRMTFVNLALIKENENAKSNFAWSTIQGTADDIKAEKDRIQYSEVFSDYESGFLVLIEGRPGSGKTTLVNKIAKDWAKGENILKGADLVFLVPLRALPKEAIHKLSDVLKLFFKGDDIASALELTKKNFGKGVCFILDGLDEYPMIEENSIISKLIHKTSLHNAMVIVASRPTATAELRSKEAIVCIKVIGFSEKQTFEYIDQFSFSDPSNVVENAEMAERVKTFLSTHINILHMCYLPVHVFIICFYVKMKGCLPKTESDIYKLFALSTLSRKSNDVKSFNQLTDNERDYFSKICKIAFQMTLSLDHIFEDDEQVLTECGTDSGASLGLITTAITLGGSRSLYSFVHLTFQEYLAACHLSTLGEQEQLEFLRGHGKQQYLIVVVKFFCGIVSLKGRESLFEEIMKTHQDHLFLCQCAFESQEGSVCQMLVKEHSDLSFSDQILNPSDFVVIQHVVSMTAGILKELTLSNCNLGGENARLFAESLKGCGSNLQSLESLDLSKNNFGSAAVHFAFLEDCGGLLRLVLSGNKIDDEGAEALAESLEYSGCSLELLDLADNAIGNTGMKSLCAKLQKHESLKTLKLSSNKIGNEGAKYISDTLKCTVNLLSLYVDNNSISGDGTASLSQGLKHCVKLETLCLNGVEISDNIAEVLSDCLKSCRLLQNLSFSNAGITDTSAVEICRCFIELKHLEKLEFNHNYIGNRGAIAFSKRLNHSDSLQLLDVASNNIGNDGAIALAESLVLYKCLTTLDVSRNSISDPGIRSLAQHLDIKILRLKGNNIGAIGGGAIADSLKRNIELEELDLSFSSIKNDAAEAIAKGLDYYTSLRKLEFDFNEIGASGIKEISKRLLFCEKLSHFKLRSNKIGDEGALALAKGLKGSNSSLQSIDLASNQIGDAGAKALGEGLGHCIELQSIDLGWNEIGDDGAKGLAKCFRKCKYIDTVCLDHNNIGNAGAKDLAKSLEKCKKLKLLNFKNNNINEAGAYALIESFRECTALETVNLEQNELGAVNFLKYPFFFDVLLDDASQDIGKAFNEQYLKDYQLALDKHICINMRFIKVILLGPPGLGKTTFRLRLMKQIVSCDDKVQPSSGVVESGNSVVVRPLGHSSALITSSEDSFSESEWTVANEHADEISMLLELFHAYVHGNFDALKVEQKRENMSDSERKLPVKQSSHADDAVSTASLTAAKQLLPNPRINPRNENTFKHSTQFHDISTSSTEHQSKTKDLHFDFAEFQALVCKASNTATKSIENLLNIMFLRIEDTGGQPEFMDMLPALTIGPALYLLFCKLTDKLQDCYRVAFRDSSGKSTAAEVESVYSVEEVLLSVLASIHCLQSPLQSDVNKKYEEQSVTKIHDLLQSSRKSAAYIVGTHVDKLPQNAKDEAIKSFDDELKRRVKCTEFRNIVQYFSDLDRRMIIPIDNYNGGEEEIKMIENFLAKGIRDHFKPLEIPAAWLMLSLYLRESKRKEKTVRFDCVLKVAKENFNIHDQDEIKLALWFLHHHAGVLMYFPEIEELDDLVICDPQIVYDSATNLIIKTLRSKANTADYFGGTGQFLEVDVKKATGEISGDYIHVDQLLKLLEYLNIIVPISSTQGDGKEYFMPCVLQNATREELDKWWKTSESNPPTLFIYYKCGYVPIGIFTALVANLVGSKGKGIENFLEEDRKKNRVQFRFGRSIDLVTLISQPRYFAIHIKQTDPEGPAHEVCSTVLHLIKSSLKAVTSRMNYSFSMEYKLAFECPQCTPEKPGRKHLCVVREENPCPEAMRCLDNQNHCSKLTDQHKVWFPLVKASDTVSVESLMQKFELSESCCTARVSELHLDEISESCCDKWRKLPSHLKVKKLVVSDMERSFNLEEDRRLNFLLRWRKKKGSDATYKSLISALLAIKCREDAEFICELLQTSLNDSPDSCGESSTSN